MKYPFTRTQNEQLVNEAVHNPIGSKLLFTLTLPSLSQIESIDPILLVRGLFIATFIATNLTLLLFSFITIQKIRILNRMLKTPLAIVLVAIGVLYFVLCVGTLFIALTLWIKPLL
jgi:hypothetical protein